MSNHKPEVTILGLGYIGLPTALLLAEKGIQVDGIDISQEKKTLLRSGKLPFEEKGLNTLFSRVKRKGTFQIAEKIKSSDYYLIAVPTPQIQGKADLTFVKQALQSIQPFFKNNQSIIIESTVGPRDCIDELIPIIASWGKSFHFAHCPERAIPGNTLHEMIHNDRIIGGDTTFSAQKVADLYKRIIKGKIYLTSTVVAASCKVMENTYRAVNIALANEFSQLAEELDFDVWEAIELANKHPRVQIHQPGPGVGGHCIPIDPWFFVGNSSSAQVISTALKKNEKMAQYISLQIRDDIKSLELQNVTIAILGYAYKKNVDDFRETPAEALRKSLVTDFQVLVSDPFVSIPMLVSEDKALSESNVWIIATDHDVYRELKLDKYPHLKYIYDARGCLTPQQKQSFKGKVHVLGKRVV